MRARKALGNPGTTVRLEHALGRGGMTLEHRSRTDGTTHEIAAAVRTHTLQRVFGAFGAEGAFKSADARLARLRRQILVAAFAIGAQFEHDGSFRERWRE